MGGGRPPGALNKATAEMKQFVQEFLSDESYRLNVRARILAGEAQGLEILLYHYAYGRPKETIKLEGEQQRQFLIVLPGYRTDPLAVEAEPVDQPERKLPALPPSGVAEVGFDMNDFGEEPEKPLRP